MLHQGGQEVSREQLTQFILPPATKTWKPISHTTVLDTALRTLEEAGYSVGKMRLGVARDAQRFFATLDLTTPLTPDGGVALAVGIRNSVDQSFPMSFCAGARVFVCDNLAFRSDLMVKRKHTVNGAARFSSDIAHAVMSLASFKEAESARIMRMQELEMTDAQAESFMLRACVDRGIVSQRHLPLVYRQWHEPKHDAFRPRTAWSLLNSFTEVLHDLQQTNPAELAHRTMRLHAMLAPPQADGDGIPDTAPALAI
jgi:hypothetical protein